MQAVIKYHGAISEFLLGSNTLSSEHYLQKCTPAFQPLLMDK